MGMEPQKWVVVRFSALGDVVLSSGVLDYWFKTRGWHFVVLTRIGLGELFEMHPAVEEIICLDNADLAFPTSIVKFRSIADRYRNYGLLDLHGTLRTRILSFFWHSCVRHYPKFTLERRLFLFSGKRFFERKLLNSNIPQRYALAVESTAPDSSLLLPQIYLSPKEKAMGKNVLLEYGFEKEKPLVAIHPYSTYSQKSWPRERWLEFMDMMDAHGLSWFIIGQDKHPAEWNADTCSNFKSADFSNKTSLRQTCALLASASVLVTADSGPMHLACAVGTPVLALFGPTTRHWGFFPAGRRDCVLEANTPGRPYSLHGRYRRGGKFDNCMLSITAADVFDTLEKMLREAED